MAVDPQRHVVSLLLLSMSVSACFATGCGGASDTSAPPRRAEQTATQTVSTAGTTTETRTAQTRSTQTTEAPLPRGPIRSKAQLLRRAEAICARANHELGGADPGDARTVESLPAASAIEVVESHAAAQLEELKAPASFSRTWRKIAGYRHALFKQLAYLLPAEREGDTAAIVRLIQTKRRLHAALAAIVKTVGIEVCAEA